MILKDPFNFLRTDSRKQLFWFFLGMSLIMTLLFRVTGAPLNTDAAPLGVVSFELAGSAPRAEAILTSWDAEAQKFAAFGLGLDFLYIAVYVLGIGLGCLLASGALLTRKWPLASYGIILAWGLVLAGLLDVIENVALLVILFGGAASPWPQIAAVCAGPKFLLVFLGLVFVFFGGVVSMVIPEDDEEQTG
jgi:hypothetical protein